LCRTGRKERWGIIDTDGNVIVEPRWKYVYLFGHGILLPYDETEKRNRYFDIAKNKYFDGIACNTFCKRVITQEGKSMVSKTSTAML